MFTFLLTKLAQVLDHGGIVKPRKIKIGNQEAEAVMTKEDLHQDVILIGMIAVLLQGINHHPEDQMMLEIGDLAAVIVVLLLGVIVALPVVIAMIEVLLEISKEDPEMTVDLGMIVDLEIGMIEEVCKVEFLSDSESGHEFKFFPANI